VRWPEVDTDRAIWTIPRERFKSDREHIVPLSDDALALLAALPRFASGQFAFTSTAGMRPVDGFGKAKLRLDAAMGVILGRPVEPFVLHDLRRTVRSRLSELRVPPVVAECVIGHALPGLLGVYDKWDYIDEKREALARWSARLSEIVQ
jgi:integrase